MTSITVASTREIFGQTLLELGRENPDITVVGGDLNKSTFANLFGREFPDRFFDMGAAEQNIMSVAAGLAFSGKIPFANTFAVFGTGRPFDQIRVGIAQPKANVKIVCTHSGITVGEDGISAQSIEDIALMCALPGFTVIVPADAPEAAQAVREAARIEGPFYIRLSRSATPVVHGEGFQFKVGKADVMRSGSDVTIVACGVMVASALEAAEGLKAEGLECRVLNMATIRPLDTSALFAAANSTGAIVVAEDHLVHSGLGAMCAQELASYSPVPMEFVGVKNRYGESGQWHEVLDVMGLTPGPIADAARRVISRKPA